VERRFQVATETHDVPLQGTPACLGIMLISGSHERAQAAFSLAASAASLGREVILFATNAGCRALRDDWSGVDDVGRDAAIRRLGLAGLGELREAARELGVRMLACETGLRGEDIDTRSLWLGVEVVGMATFLEAASAGQLISL